MEKISPEHEQNLLSFDDSQQMRRYLCEHYGHMWQPTVLGTLRMCRRCKQQCSHIQLNHWNSLFTGETVYECGFCHKKYAIPIDVYLKADKETLHAMLQEAFGIARDTNEVSHTTRNGS